MTTARRDPKHQTPFGKWMNENPRLESRQCGLGITDTDWIIHQYKGCTDHLGERLIQNLLFIEEKTFCKEPPPSQLSTLRLVYLIMAGNCHNSGPAVHKVIYEGKRITVRNYGYHLLQFSRTDPVDSKHIWWDRKPITATVLEDILRFDVSPKTLRRRDPSERRHHGGAKQRKLDFQPVICNTCDEFICTCREWPEDRDDPCVRDEPEL